MKGFLFYMIIGSALTIFRFYLEPASDRWSEDRKKTIAKVSDYSVVQQLFFFLAMSLAMIPITLTDYTLYFIVNPIIRLVNLRRNRLNSPEVKADVAKYVYFGLLHGEAVSYSMVNRFNAEEAEAIEVVFKEAEQRIIKYGFIPYSVGQFVELYQDRKPLPRLRIKGKNYPEGT